MIRSVKEILIISEVFAPEEFIINDLVFSWKKQGFLVSVLTRNPSYPLGKVYPGYKNSFFQREIINDVPVYRVQFIPGYKVYMPVKILNYLWNMFLGLLWAIKNGKKFDSIYVYHTGPLTFASIGVFIKKIYKKKVTIWTQDVWPDTVHAYGIANGRVSGKILDWFVKWIYTNCDNVVVSCPGFIPILSRYCSPKKIQFIPQWSLTSRAMKEDEVGVQFPGKINFVFAGNIGKVQNLENAILGFSRYINNDPHSEVWFNIIGDGSHLNNLKKLVNDSEIKNVRFWGRVKSDEINAFYSRADVLIIALENKPIFNLTIPAKFQSYLNAQKPIFGIINGEVADLIKTYDLGWVAKPDDILEIARFYREIVESPAEVKLQKVKNSSLLTENQFNREKIIRNFTELVFG